MKLLEGSVEEGGVGASLVEDGTQRCLRGGTPTEPAPRGGAALGGRGLGSLAEDGALAAFEGRAPGRKELLEASRCVGVLEGWNRCDAIR